MMSTKLSAEKAQEILSDGKVHNKKLTKKQKAYFRAIAHDWKPKAEGGLKDDPKFTKKLADIALSLDTSPDILMDIFHAESTLDPAKRNPKTKATGLIQFMPETAIQYGTNVDALRKMSAVQQLDYVYKYLKPYKGRINTFEDAYFSVFYPSAIKKDDDYVLGEKNRRIVAIQNSGYDVNKDEVLTRGEVLSNLYERYPHRRPVDTRKYIPEIQPSVADNTAIVPQLTTDKFITPSIGLQPGSLLKTELSVKEDVKNPNIRTLLMQAYEDPSMLTDINFMMNLYTESR